MTEDSRIGRVVGTAGSPMYPSIADHWATHLIKPTGHLPFGTKVTVHGLADGQVTLAIVTESIDHGVGFGYQVYVKGDGLIRVGAQRLTLGWLPADPQPGCGTCGSDSDECADGCLYQDLPD